MKLTIEKSTPCGEIAAPASKSDAHRLLICAGLSGGKSVISNIDFSQDIEATLRCLEALGCKIKRAERSVEIDGIESFDYVGAEIFDCGESGSTLRFFIPVCLLSGKKITFTGSKKLLSRPLDVYEEICRKQGIKIKRTETEITFDGRLSADIFYVKGNISSQFISGLLFALPLLKAESEIKILPPFESRPYVDMTLSTLQKFGVSAEFADSLTLKISGGQKYIPRSASVEGDWSNAAFFYAFKESGAPISITGTDENSLQGDKICVEHFRNLKSGFSTVDLADCPDLAPILFAFAAKHSGGKFTNTARLRMKESDRITAMQQELKKVGAELVADENEVTVYPAKLAVPSEPISSHNDHRIAMSMAYLLTFTGGGIDGYEAVRKSWPDFFKELKKTGVKINYEA